MTWKMFDKTMWVLIAIAGGAGLVAVGCFGWEPPSRLLGVAVFATMAWTARARFILVKRELE